MGAPVTDGPDPRMPFSVAALAERWACSEGAIRNQLRAGRLAYFRIGTLIRIPAAEVDRFEAASLVDARDSTEGSSR